MKDTMFALVKFEENSLKIYPMKCVHLKENDRCVVKHKGTKYEATLLMMHESKDYLEKYANTYSSPEIPSLEECKNNSISVDFSDFSIGSEFLDIPSSSSILDTSFRNIEETNLSPENAHIGGEDPTENQVDSSRGGYSDEISYFNSSQDETLTDTEDTIGGERTTLRGANSKREKRTNINSVSASSQKNISGYEDEDNITEYDDPYSDDDDPVFQPEIEPESDSDSDSEQSASEVEGVNSSLLNNYSSEKILRNTIDSTNDVCEKENLQVSVSKTSGGGGKKNFCLFCHKKLTKLARHLETVHKNEDAVKKYAILPKGCEERREMIRAIRKKGNFQYNTKSCLNDGTLIVSRRPNSSKLRKATDFVPCMKCKAFYSKNSLRVHFRACTGISSSKTRCAMVSGKKIESRIHSIANEMVREKLFPPLRDDDIVRSIKYDELVIVYANKMCEKYRNERYFEMIRQRIRLIGRCLKALKEKNENIHTLSDVFDPAYCHDTIQVVNALAGAQSETGNFKTPTVASSLCTLLKYITKIHINQCIIKHDDVKRKNAKHFLLLFSQEVEINVTRTVTESQVQMRRRKTVDLPSTDDIRKFYNYLRKNLEISYCRLKNKFSVSTWLNLAEYALLSIQVFNRRRPGELERILIEDFKSYEGIDINDGDGKELSENREASERYVRFLIRGKLNRTVPVILDKKQVKSIELLLKYRNSAKISNKNPYVFAVPGVSNMKFIRSCNIIRKHAILCGATHPERLRGTNLRKHIATTCIRLNLEENEVKDLANFMGHSEKIHHNIYRQPVASRDILRVSRLLEKAGGENEDKEASDSDSQQEEEEPREIKKKRSISPYGSVKRRRWTVTETEIALREFEKNIESGKLPSFKEIQEVKLRYSQLKGRSSPQIKTWVHNQLRKKMK